MLFFEACLHMAWWVDFGPCLLLPTRPSSGEGFCYMSCSAKTLVKWWVNYCRVEQIALKEASALPKLCTR
jgi:hypothetical protein